MQEIEKRIQEEAFDIEVQYCDPDDCLRDCLVGTNNCTAVALGIWQITKRG